jgi:hypothetical protein
MPDGRRRRVDDAFHGAFTRKREARATGLLSPSLIRRERDRALNAVSTLITYRDFLGEARTHKVARQGASLEFERELDKQADHALQAARQLGGATLRSAGHVRNTGWFDVVLDSWHDAIGPSGHVRLRDVLADVFDDPAARDALEEAGLTQAVRGEISRVVDQVGLFASVQDGKLRVEIPAGQGNGTHTVTLGPDPRPGRPRNVADLLAQRRFDTVARALDTSAFAVGDVVPGARATVGREPSELLLTGATMIVQQVARHRRGLHDAGLALHEGSDPASVVGFLVVASAVLAVVAFVLLLMCGEGADEACVAAAVIFGLALLFFAGAVCLAEGVPRPDDGSPANGEEKGLCVALILTAVSFIASGLD